MNQPRSLYICENCSKPLTAAETIECWCNKCARPAKRNTRPGDLLGSAA